MRYLLLLLPFLALAQPAARPAPAPFNPALDAPHTIGQPGHLDPVAYSKSPYGRVLPETPETRREPGIWAGKESVTVIDPQALTLLGVVLPIFANEDGVGDAGPTMLCAKHWNMALATDVAKWVHEIKDQAVRGCLAALMHEECAKVPELMNDFLKSHGIVDMNARKMLPEVLRRAEAFTDMMCREARSTGFYADRFRKLVPIYHGLVAREARERMP